MKSVASKQFTPALREWYWVPHPSKVWITVLVRRVVGDTVWVTTSDSMTEFELSVTDCPFLSLNPRIVNDMASLMHLHEAGILHNLCERANPQNQHPYTYVSTVLIALNPLRPVPMPTMENYKNIPMSAVPPNPYGVAEMAYKNLTVVRNEKARNQSIIISGESGAGKTETAKIVLRYLCWRATEGKMSTSVCKLKNPGGGASLDKKLLDTNPILEAFGNAKTFRNSNSSRFGKFLKLEFDSFFELVSASIDTYLLEKSRVALFPLGERNYHVFYQLIRGAGPVERKRWLLRDIDYYRYLNYGKYKDIEDVNDRADFSVLTSGLLSVGIDIVQQDMLFRVLSAVLHLGNINFESVEKSTGECAEFSDERLTSRVAELLGVRRVSIEAILTTRSLDMVSAGGRTSSYRIPLDVKQATFTRDAIAKTIYNTVFHWVVKKIRQSLNTRESITPSNYIGVLDIFGFESFENNGLEQLLINYANESLQLIFNRSVLDAEQEMYREEGFMVEPIEYVNNNECVNLIAMGRDSILTSLDAVCKAPEPTEEKFNSLIHKTHSKNSHFLKPELKNMISSFKIKHYAKVVQYTVGTFIQKNMDSCPAELLGLMASSSFASRCSLFSFDPDVDELYEDISAGITDAVQSRLPTGCKSRTQKFTMGKKFKIQMNSLCDLLNSTNCSFIRCVKPNHSMTPGIFEHRFVVEQIRSLGIVQTCEVLRQGLPARVQFTEIEAIYRVHFYGVNSALTEKMTGRDFTEAVLWAFGLSRSDYKLGKSRVFFNINALNDMNTVLNSYTDPVELDLLVRRVIRFVHLKRWRRVFMAGYTYSQVLRLYESCRIRRFACIVIQRRWKFYSLSNLRARKILARKRWKISMIYTLFCNYMVSNYRLICEAREMRLRAEKAAARRLEESRAAEIRQQQLIDEMAIQEGVDTDVATKNCAKKFRESLSFGRQSTSLVHHPEISETGDVFQPSNEFENALMAQQLLQSKSEMKKLAAASSLATVSVALFRWTKIKKFRAFEKWMQFYKTGEMMAKAVMQKDSESIGLSSTRLDRDSDHIENLVLADGSYLCFECKDRSAKVWCHDCNQPYCLVCSQFVHNSCNLMRYHRPLSIDHKPSPENISLLSTPMEPLSSFVAAGTMKAMVNAILFSECNIGNRNSSIPKMLYYSGASNEFNLEGIGNQASVLLDRLHNDRSALEDKIDVTQQAIAFTGSGGMCISNDDMQQCAIRSCEQPATKGVSIRFCSSHYDEFRIATRGLSDGRGEFVEGDDANTLQQQIALLKKQLIDSGQQPVEFVELSVARALMQEAVERLLSGEESAEAEVEKWDKAIRLNPEYQAEMLEKARKWEEDERPANLACLRQMRCIIPLNVREISAATMQDLGLPKKVAQRIWSKKILWFICTHPDDIGRVHVADLRSKYSYIGLDIVEMRAVYAALPITFENDGDGKKKEWRDSFRQKLEELTSKEAGNRLTNPEKRNFAYKGHDNLAIFDPDVPIPRAELLKSDAFGPTDVSNIAELNCLGGSVREKQNKMMTSSDRTTNGTTDEIYLSDISPDDIKENERNEGVKTRLIAESALAADEQKRAEARGSLITVMSNPLVDQEALSALRRSTEQDSSILDELESDSSSSALDGGIETIRQTIMKMELAKKNHKVKSTEEKEAETKKHFSEQFIAKGVRHSGGNKPFGGGRGRGRGTLFPKNQPNNPPSRGSGMETFRDSESAERFSNEVDDVVEMQMEPVQGIDQSSSVGDKKEEVDMSTVISHAPEDRESNSVFSDDHCKDDNSQLYFPDDIVRLTDSSPLGVPPINKTTTKPSTDIEEIERNTPRASTIQERGEKVEEMKMADDLNAESFSNDHVRTQPNKDTDKSGKPSLEDNFDVKTVSDSTSTISETNDEFSKIVFKKKERVVPKKKGLWGLMKSKK